MARCKDKYWKMIDEIGWEFKTTDYNKIGKKLLKKYSIKEIHELQEFVYEKYSIMYNTLRTEWLYWRTINLSDDSYSDLCASIVGQGRLIYNAVRKRPGIAISIAEMYAFSESFLYCFHAMNRYVEKNMICKLRKKLNE